jgi:hypothetical protein
MNPLRHPRFSVARAVFAAAILLPAGLSGQTFVCAPATAAEMVAAKAAITSIVSSGDSGARAIYHLSPGPASGVAIDSTLKNCQVGGQWFKTAYPGEVTPGGTYRMFVLKVGSDRWVLINADFHPSGRTVIITFDREWRLLGEVVN